MDLIIAAAVLYRGWSMESHIPGMTIESPNGNVYYQDVEACPGLDTFIEQYNYFTEWVDLGAPQPDTCIVLDQATS